MRRTIFLLTLILLSTNLFSQSKKSKSQKEIADIVLQASLQKHIHTLALDETLEDSTINCWSKLKGTAYLISQYKKWGIEPLGDSNNFVQHFKIDEGLEIKTSTYLNVNGIPLKTKIDYWPFSFCGKASFSGTATWTGNEESEPLLFDLKNVLAANITNPNFDISKFIYDKTIGLAIKKTTALFIYNSSETNDNLVFSTGGDTSAILPIPVVYLTKSGIAKMKNESPIANALDGHFVVGEKIFDGSNTIGFIDNGAENTVIISSHFNYNTIDKTANKNTENLNGTVIVLELARLLKQLCVTENKNKNKTSALFNLKNNNYCFIDFCEEQEGFYGSNYLMEHLPLKLSKINYLISFDKIGNSNDSLSFINVDGLKSSLTWADNILPNDSLIKLMPTTGLLNKNSKVFHDKSIPFLFFNNLNNPSFIETKKSVIDKANFINYILKLISNTDEKGKLIFNSNNN